MSSLAWFSVAAVALVVIALAFVLPGLMKTGKRRRAAAWLTAASVPIAATALYLAVGAPQSFDGSSDLAPTTAADYVSRLESHLRRQPRDARGWVLLARAHAEADRFDAAGSAFAQALAVSPDKVAKDPSVLCEYADVLAMQQGGRLAGAPLQLVNRALELNDRHPVALEMAGSAAYEEGRYADTVRYWNQLLLQLRPGSQKHMELSAAVARAQQKATPARTP